MLLILRGYGSPPSIILRGYSSPVAVPPSAVPLITDCLSRWGEARWGEYRWGEIHDLIAIVDGSVTPTGALVKTPSLIMEGSVAPTGDLAFPPEWTVALPPSRPGGYPTSTRRRAQGPVTRTDQVPPTTEEV